MFMRGPTLQLPPEKARQESRLPTDDLVERLLSHPLYGKINNENMLKLFMQSHVFCVWDFQSLLKALQRHLTCVEIPWLPTSDPRARRLINEIVLEEESDIVGDGYLSHFELYLEAMKACEADLEPILAFLSAMKRGCGVKQALLSPEIPKGVAAFVETTLSIAQSGEVHRVAAAFAYGREDIIPRMFQPLVFQLSAVEEGRWSLFLDYLKRHIEYDGERHGPLSKTLLARLCGDSEQLWAEAQETARASLQARLAFWDTILTNL